ncbi:MAG: hypothetical protein Q9217_000080 [Psora testacea]
MLGQSFSPFTWVRLRLRRQTTKVPRKPPFSIDELLRNSGKNRRERSRQLTWARSGAKTDRPIDSLYRLFENIIEDWTIELRNEIEYFWNQHQWAVSAIPDPQDPDPTRYAVLAVIPKLLVKAFNRNIEMGLPRDAPAIITDFDELQARPKILEEEPGWCKQVPALEETLVLPNEEGIILEGKRDENASPEFLEKNILALAHHIYFV